MKVYSTNIPTPEFSEAWVDGRFNHKAWEAANERYFKAVADDLREKGWDGKYTGNIWMHGMGDGAAQYMVASKGNRMVLIHLPIDDAWRLPDAHERGLTATEIRNYCNAKPLFGEKVKF